MAIDVTLPALGESVVEGTVSRWLVKEGDRVERDQPLVEVTTDKVDAEIPSPAAGVVEALLVAEGDTVAVGAVLARIAAQGEAAQAPPRSGVRGAQASRARLPRPPRSRAARLPSAASISSRCRAPAPAAA